MTNKHLTPQEVDLFNTLRDGKTLQRIYATPDVWEDCDSTSAGLILLRGDWETLRVKPEPAPPRGVWTAFSVGPIPLYVTHKRGSAIEAKPKRIAGFGDWFWVQEPTDH